MLQANINQIKLFIDEFKQISLNEIFANSYPDVVDLNSLQITRFSVSEFVTLSNSFFEQLDNEIDNGNGLILPLYFSNPEFGQADLQTQISSFLANIKSAQFQASENILAWLLTYQLQNGFYNKSQYKLHPISVTEAKKVQGIIDLQIQDINHLKEKYESGIAELKAEKDQLTEFKLQKENELLQISNNLETTNTNNNAIQNLLTLSSQSNTKVESILLETIKESRTIQQVSEEMDKAVAKSKAEYNEYLKTLKDTESKYKNLYKDFETMYGFVKGKHDYFEERNIYLDTLIGREVGASLFETFKQRKNELDNPLRLWRTAIGMMTLITVLGVFAIFTNFFGMIPSANTNPLSWEIIVVNSIKSSPFIFLLYYTISQYNKERNFQEEYAFKSAVALTINAYADVLKEDKSKDELILKAVYGIYRSPIYNKIKANKEVNSVLDIFKEAMDKGVGILKKDNGG